MNILEGTDSRLFVQRDVKTECINDLWWQDVSISYFKLVQVKDHYTTVLKSVELPRLVDNENSSTVIFLVSSHKWFI